MKILAKICLILGILSSATLVIGGAVSDGFNKREAFKNKTQLGDPNAASQIIDTKGDVSHLTNLNDNNLMDKGKEQLQTSPFGNLLQNAEEKKIDAKQKYQINGSNGMLKDSHSIEENPMAKTGGGRLSGSEKVSNVKIEKTCVEGVDFDVDVGVELVLEAEEEEYLSKEYEHEKTEREVWVPGDVIHHQGGGKTYTIFWKKKRHGLHLRIDQPGWRIFLANRLNIPIDNIAPSINFPDGARGVGDGTHPVGGQVIVFDNYRFKYTYRWKKKLKKCVL